MLCESQKKPKHKAMPRKEDWVICQPKGLGPSSFPRMVYPAGTWPLTLAWWDLSLPRLVCLMMPPMPPDAIPWAVPDGNAWPTLDGFYVNNQFVKQHGQLIPCEFEISTDTVSLIRWNPVRHCALWYIYNIIYIYIYIVKMWNIVKICEALMATLNKKDIIKFD